MTIQINATEQYFSVVLYIMIYKVVLTLGLCMKSYRVTKVLGSTFVVVVVFFGFFQNEI